MAFGPVDGGDASARVAPYDPFARTYAASNLYVASIPLEFGEEELKEKFSPFGAVISCRVLKDPITNTNRGVGFVQLNSPEEAQAAIDGISAEGTMQVKFADKDKGASKGKGKGKSEFAPVPGPAANDNLYIKGLPKDLDQPSLEALFTVEGWTVAQSKILSGGNQHITNAAFVKLGSEKEAAAAIEKMSGQILPGSETPIYVSIATPKSQQLQQQPPWQPAAAAGGGWQVAGWQQPADPWQAMAAWFGGGPGAAWQSGGAGASWQSPASSAPAQSTDNLYVSNLPAEIDQAVLSSIFVSAGYTVSTCRILPPPTSRMGADGAPMVPKRAAMVRLASVEEAADAIQKLDGQTVDGLSEPMGVKYANAPAQGKGVGKELPPWQAAAPPPWMMQPGQGGGGKPMLKMKMCIHHQNGTCAKGFECTYAHSEAEIGTPQGSGKAAGKGAVQSAPPAVARATGSMTLQVRYAGAEAVPSDNLYIAGLPSPQIDMPTLKSLFTSLDIEPIRMKVMPDTQGRGVSAAMVQVASQEVAAQCIEALDSQTISCEEIREAGGMMEVDSGRPPMVVKYAGADETPSDNVFMSGLPSPQVEPAVLVKLCAALDLKVVRTKPMPDSRGIGHSQALVQFASQEEAATAIAMLNGEVFPDDLGEGGDVAGHGVPLTVRYQGSGEPSDNLYISGLPSPQVDQASLASVFSGLGFTVTRSRILPDTQSRGASSAMVQLGSKEEAAAAIEALNGQIVDGLKAEAAATVAPPAGGSASLVAERAQWQVAQAMASAMAQWQSGSGEGWQSQSSGGWQEQAAAVPTFSPPPAQLAMQVKGKGKSSPYPSPAAPAARVGAVAQRLAAAAAASASGTISVKYAGAAQQPSANLYLSGLPGQGMELATLKALFETLQLTIVRSKIIPDSKGLGSHSAMVQLQSQAEAASAIDQLNGQTLSEQDLCQGSGQTTNSQTLSPAPAPTPARGGAEPSIKEWLQSLDDSGVMMQYSDGLTENFDSLKQLRECFVHGKELDNSFFVELNIKKIGHKKLFQKYFQENAL